jgi:ADP-ribose pyrophosphatase
MAEDTKPSRIEIVKRERLLDAFFKVDRVTVSHERFSGGMSEPRPFLVMDRGDAVAALLYDPERRKVLPSINSAFHAWRLGRRLAYRGHT